MNAERQCPVCSVCIMLEQKCDMGAKYIGNVKSIYF